MEGMGSKSIENCLRGLILANKFASERRKEQADPPPWFHRLGFVPQLRKSGELLWVSLKVIPLKEPYVASARPEGDRLRVGPNSEVKGLSTAIMRSWSKRCADETSEPRVCAMGTQNVATAVRALARCLKEMNARKGLARLFVCAPEMLPEVLENGQEVTMTQIRLEMRPRG